MWPLMVDVVDIVDETAGILLAHERRRRPKTHGAWARIHRSHGTTRGRSVGPKTVLLERKHLRVSLAPRVSAGSGVADLP